MEIAAILAVIFTVIILAFCVIAISGSRIAIEHDTEIAKFEIQTNPKTCRHCNKSNLEKESLEVEEIINNKEPMEVLNSLENSIRITKIMDPKEKNNKFTPLSIPSLPEDYALNCEDYLVGKDISQIDTKAPPEVLNSLENSMKIQAMMQSFNEKNSFHSAKNLVENLKPDDWASLVRDKTLCIFTKNVAYQFSVSDQSTKEFKKNRDLMAFAKTIKIKSSTKEDLEKYFNNK